ncbi:MAG: glycosyltransferase family 4 protein [Pseudomonadota bacterium]
MKKKLLFVVNVDWGFLSNRLAIALEAIRQGYEVHLAACLTGKQAELERQGIIVHSLEIDRKSADVGSVLKLFWQIIALFKQVRPDIVHLVTIKPVLFGGVAARFFGIKSVLAAVPGLGFVFLGTGFEAIFRRWIVAILYRLAFGKHNLKVIFQNPHDCNTLVRITGLDRKKIVMIRGSGVDLSIFKPAPFPQGIPMVMMAARLLYDKGVVEFVEAARLLHKRGFDVRFCLVGEPDFGNPSSVTKEDLSLWRSEGVVDLLGYRDDMSNIFAQSYLFVLPSYREGLSKVLIEAAACGRAVVTTDMPGCRDAIEPNVTGLLVPVRDPDALADSIQRLLIDRELCEKMGLAGRQLAEREFAIEKVVAVHLKVYQNLMEAAL